MHSRRAHYGEFYELKPVDDRGPLAMVFGNCQAESLRIMLEGPDVQTVRVPPVFELVAADLPFLERMLARTTLLITQPVRDDYHDLPLGTRQLTAALPGGARVVRMPVIRFAGLYPFQAIVRPPADPGAVPPVVPYHDLRTLVEAHRLRRLHRRRGDGSVVPEPADFAEPAEPAAPTRDLVERIRQVAADSVAELERRETHHDTVVVSDLFARPTFDLMRTINHPGNAVWSAAARRVRHRLGLAEHDVDPGRPLLDAVHAPREAAVIAAFDLDDDPRPDWIVSGTPVSATAVRLAHLDWYAANPGIIDAGLTRHAHTLATLGLLP
ncbi:WcbI family polysaccharide biosynthesis putative acetyltransferase [Subtercola vilae]|uniref:WcbI family polysaccharide biosynthesis putative acetyltransferase n=1 Tax=Subtercola vilae TaxID=2056433 RepID=UPI0013757DD2|nr:WcbI family polysaccharide biosynthesis putative acetyltransferase [Subtercola vilae]